MIYKIKLKLKSLFATPPKGDTLFGQFCWSIVRLYGEDKLANLLDGYTRGTPFVVTSDFLPKNHICKPPIPDFLLGVSSNVSERKALKNKKYICIDELVSSGYNYSKEFIAKCSKDKKAFELKDEVQIRNSINRLSGTTGDGESGFAPFANEVSFFPFDEATLYVYSDGHIDKDTIVETLSYIGKSGFGKDATVGRGRFDVTQIEEVAFNCTDFNAYITLSPAILSEYNEIYYEPFVRYGKHGDALAHSQVWKNPILLADSFACVISDEKKEFIGKGLGGNGEISRTLKATVHQGYSVVIPARVDNTKIYVKSSI